MQQKISYASLDSLDESFHSSFDAALKRVQATLGATHSMFIGGKPRKSTAGTFADYSPTNGQLLLGRFAQGTAEDAQRAVTAAKLAFQEWRKVDWRERVALMRKAAEVMTDRQFDMAALLVLEVGKNRVEALAEVGEAIELIHYYCQQMEEHQGFEIPMARQGSEQTKSVLKPYGVWAVMSPFNFPLALPTGMAVAALLGGNTVVFKPASQAPFAGLMLYEALQEANLPEGVFNFITGPGYVVGEELVMNTEVEGFAFAGSRAIGMQIMNRFGVAVPKPCIVEMGGKNPVIVMPSANLEDAAEGVVRSAFGMAGQKCSACSRLYVHRAIYRPFMDLLQEKTAALKVGDPAERETFLGPLINALAAKRYDRLIRGLKKEGRVSYGGARMRRGQLARGFFVKPTIVERLPATSRVFADELFTPILPVRQVGSLGDAIAHSNASDYGLTAGIYTEDEKEQKTFFDEIEAGTTYCNRRAGATTGAWPGVQSFGGWKCSGSTGKSALGPHYLPQFMREQSQTVVTR